MSIIKSDIIVLGLGSNLGDCAGNLKRALEMVGELLENVTESKIYESKALLPENAPAEWNKGFYNLVIYGSLREPRTPPHKFLHKIKNIEAALGRKPGPKWAPRVIDIDILAWGNEIIDEPDLKIPHPHMLERDFVMVPLTQILPNWQHPLNKVKA